MIKLLKCHRKTNPSASLSSWVHDFCKKSILGNEITYDANLLKSGRLLPPDIMHKIYSILSHRKMENLLRKERELKMIADGEIEPRNTEVILPANIFLNGKNILNIIADVKELSVKDCLKE